MSKIGLLKELPILICLSASFIVLTVFLQYHTARYSLHLEAESDNSGEIHVFWKQDGEEYSAKRFSKYPIKANEETVIDVDLPKLSAVDHIAVFPIIGTSVLKLDNVSLRYQGKEEANFLADNRLSLLENQRQLVFASDGNTITSLRVLAKGAFLEIPIKKMSTSLFRWGSLIGGSLLLAVFSFFLLNQYLIKGSPLTGYLQIYLPANKVLEVPRRNNCPFLSTGFAKHEDNGICTYQQKIPHISPGAARDLVSLVRAQNPEAEVYFQYNRAGEIL